MHDPMTVAFEIRSPIKRKSLMFPGGYRESLITIWHVDPEKDGTDDSCGWFMRSRHGNKEVLQKIEKCFLFELYHESEDKKYNWGLLTKEGLPRYSVSSIVLNLFNFAHHEMHHDWKKSNRFLSKHLVRILLFAENSFDSLHGSFYNNHSSLPERAHSLACCIYSWILRAERPWYRHPRWHVWHWKIQVHPLQNLKRWLFSRCATCGKKFRWGESPVTSIWDSTGPLWFRSEKGIRHCNCPDETYKPVVQ